MLHNYGTTSQLPPQSKQGFGKLDDTLDNIIPQKETANLRPAKLSTCNRNNEKFVWWVGGGKHKEP